jgi:hypothetical protein
MNIKVSAPFSADGMVRAAPDFAESPKSLRHSMPLDRAGAAMCLTLKPLHERIHALFH